MGLLSQSVWQRVLVAVVVSLSCQPLTSGTAFSKVDLVELYLDAAFAGKDSKIEKLTDSRPIRVYFNCGSSDACRFRLPEYLDYIFPSNMIEGIRGNFVGAGAGDGVSAPIEIQFGGDKGSDFQTDFIAKHLVSGSSPEVVGNAQCKAVRIVRGDEILKVGINVDLASPETFISACIASQLYWGVGLNFPARLSFQDLWDGRAVQLSKFSDRDLGVFFIALQAVIKLHSCSSILPGMTKQQVVDILQSGTCQN